MDVVLSILDAVSAFLWERTGFLLLCGVGVLMTFVTGGFALRHFGHCMRRTVGSLFCRATHTGEQGEISQFQAACTALAGCIGVGNIAGVATAIVAGGPGAVFWMWMAALLGMSTAYGENVLGILYRRRAQEGWKSGAMYYLRAVPVIGRALAAVFAFFCILASFGVGNMTQVNTIVINLTAAFPSALSSVGVGATDLYTLVLGVLLTVLIAVVIFGGMGRIARLTERVVPLMVVLYLAGTLWVIFAHAHNILPAFASIFRYAFGFAPAAGGVLGYGVKSGIEWGFRRGVFSNEAGLGLSVTVNCASNTREPAEQGMWAIFEVFADTIVMCTCTALLILTSGLVDLSTGAVCTDARATTLVAEAFSGVFGAFGGAFVAVCIFLFAFSTVLGCSCYGGAAWEYLFGARSAVLYRILYIVAAAVGTVASLETVWRVADIFNGFIMLPNIAGLILLSPRVRHATRNYTARVFPARRAQREKNRNDQISFSV